MLIDDDAESRKVVAAILTAAGNDVICAVLRPVSDAPAGCGTDCVEPTPTARRRTCANDTKDNEAHKTTIANRRMNFSFGTSSTYYQRHAMTRH